VIVLDSDVLSAVMRRDQVAVQWLDRQRGDTIWLTAVTVFEVTFGLEIMPRGRRCAGLEEGFKTCLDEDFGGRVIPLDGPAASEAAVIAAAQRRIGYTLDIRDAQIAGIVAASSATLATRNTRHFEQLGISLVDPWLDK
jgi:hypothetical protein